MQQNKKNKKQNADTLRKNFEDKLPKNVRQIGNVSQDTKIYIEDYVLSYLKRIQKENHVQEKKFAIVLVGEKHVSLKTTYYFVVGAVTLNVNVREDSKAMPESLRKQLERTIETYFGKENSALCQLGWGSELPVADKIPAEYEVFHRENFGSGNMIFLGFNEDFEEIFYISENGKLKKQNGYYVYFDRNEGMQQYVQDNQPAQSVEAEPGSRSNSEQYKFLLANHKEDVQKKRIITFLYTASTFLVIVVIVLGVTLINHYDKLKDMQEVIASLSQSVLDGPDNGSISGAAVQNLTSSSALQETQTGYSEDMTPQAVQIVSGDSTAENIAGTDFATANDVNTESVGTDAQMAGINTDDTGTDAGNSGENADNTASNTVDSENTASVDGSDIASVNQSNEMSGADNTVDDNNADAAVESSSSKYEQFLSEQFRCYEVKDGDTLSGICKRLYGSMEYFDKICEYNHIENTDEIKVGQKIWVP